jgi:CHASE3 domain sensor protein
VTTWTLRRRVVALCVAVGVLLTALGIVAVFTAATSNDRIEDVLNRTGPMRADGQSLVTAMVDQETGIRGYAISGRETTLDPYRRGQDDQRRLIAEIDGLLRPPGEGDDGIRAALRDVQTHADQWRAAIATPVLTAVRTRGPEAGRALVAAASTAQFDALRASIGRLQQQILVVRNQSAEQLRNAGSTLVAIQIAAAAIIVLAGAALLLLLDRVVSRPVMDLAEQVR